MNRTRSLTRFGVALAAMAGAVLAACSTDPAQPAATPTSTSAAASSWMEAIYGDHPDVTLGSVLIPGTHDSGSYGIDVTEPCENTVIAGTIAPVQALKTTEPCMLAGFSRAQDVDLGVQLASGIRYLDMRVGVPSDKAIQPAEGRMPPPANPLDVPLVTHHTVVSAPLSEALDQILRFARDHPKEQVILDFQHVDLPSDPDVAAYYKSVLNSYLHEYAPAGESGAGPVCSRAWTHDVIKTPDRDLSRKVSFGEAWKADRNLIVLADPEGLPKDNCYRNRDLAILSQWPYTDDPDVSATYNRTELEQRQRKMSAKPPKCVGTQSIGANEDGTPKAGSEPANWCGFFVSQLQLSMSNSMYAGCVLDPRGDCSLFSLALRVNPGIGTEMTGWAAAGLPANISIADFFQYGSPSMVDVMIQYNRRSVASQGR